MLNVERSFSDLNDELRVTGEQVLERIKARAIARWGEEKWVVNLVREYVNYVKRVKAKGHENATPLNRRSQVERAFEVGSCTLDTAIALAAAVGCRFQLACIEVTIEEF